jgi:hypothetical protein
MMMGGLSMKTLRFIALISLSLGLLQLAGCAPTPSAATSQAQIPPVAAGTARVWFFRQSDPPGGNVFAADPMITANDAPLSQIKQGTAFFHDFPPGRYKFKVQAFGTPTGERDTIQLAPGTQTYLQVEWVPNWQTGSTVGGSSFVIQPASPEIAQQYIPTLTNLGQR